MLCFASPETHALAIAEFAALLPGMVAQPLFSTISCCRHEELRNSANLSGCAIKRSTHTGARRETAIRSARSFAILSAVLPRTQPHQAKPIIMIPNAPTTTPQNAGLHHGGTFMRHLLQFLRALRSTLLIKTCD